MVLSHNSFLLGEFLIKRLILKISDALSLTQLPESGNALKRDEFMEF